jgi:multicomponent Na+:H+ antiporter subunit A
MQAVVQNAPLAALAFLVGGVLLQILAGRALSNRAKGALAAAAGLAAFACLALLIPSVASGQQVEIALADWDAGIPVLLRIDGLGLLFALMASGIGSAILVYSAAYMASEPSGVTRFYALMLAFIAGFIHLVFSANLLLAYLSWELIGLCSYFLVGFWYRDPAAAGGARKVLLMTHLPGYAFLLGILLLFQHSGTFLWTDPALAQHFTTGIFVLMLAAAMAKSVMVPLHTWIPEAMNAPTPVSALLHSACYVKAGIYLIARSVSLYGTAPLPEGWNITLQTIGCITMLAGAVFALAQTDLKRLLAYSTISQLGYIVAGLGLGTPAAAAAALFYTLSHGLFKGALFLCAGSVQHAAGTRDMRRLGGLASNMPWTARSWLIASAAIIGVPFTNGFVAKWLLFDAAIDGGQWPVLVIAWLVSIITAFYILKATLSVFYGSPPQNRAAQPHEADLSMRLGMGVLAGLCLLFGLAPQILTRWVVTPAILQLGYRQPGAVSWLGLHTSAAAEPSGAGAAVLLLALAAAAAGYLLTRPARSQETVSIFGGGDPLPEESAARVEDYSDLAQTVLRPVIRVANPDPTYGFIWNSIRRVSGGAAALFAPLENHPLLAALALAALALALIWLL